MQYLIPGLQFVSLITRLWMIDLRYHINHPILGLGGAHMGYSVHSSEGNKGYAREMLRLHLLKCKDRNMDKVMVTCSRDNTASEKITMWPGRRQFGLKILPYQNRKK